jgi:hypothetical protein
MQAGEGLPGSSFMHERKRSMRRALVAVLGIVFVLAVWTATAAADPGQTAGQANTSGQSAGSLAGAGQAAPSNTAVGIRVLSPGDDGDVSQSNDVSATSGAVNLNGTGQSIDQSQGGSGTQVAGQESSSEQSADAAAIAAQKDPSNTAVGIRVLSPGDGGDVSQSNSADAGALAANGNLTGQSVDQSQGAAPCGCGGTQVAGQDNASEQSAEAGAIAAQDKPSNTAVGIRVLSPGDGGDVSQSNSADAGALAANGNFTHQTIDQTQGGSPSCGCGHGGTQVAGQSNASGQAAFAAALGLQLYPSNTATTTSVGYGGGCGCNSHVAAPAPSTPGNVTQSNDVSAHALALNLDLTGQSIHQAGSGTQVAGQRNANLQGAAAIAAALQFGAANRAP